MSLWYTKDKSVLDTSKGQSLRIHPVLLSALSNWPRFSMVAGLTCSFMSPLDQITFVS